jgi:hypothetical protein
MARAQESVVSVHVPKTAGSTFRLWLATAFPCEGSLFLDYLDRPVDPLSHMNLDPKGFLVRQGKRRLPKGAKVVHGHFWARKYEAVPDAFRMTFLRDPIDRTVSHYWYWMTHPPGDHSLHQRVLREKYTIEQFVQLPLIRGVYSLAFFRETDMSSFDFIGDFARFEREVDRLERLLGRRGDRNRQNKNEDPAYADRKAETLAPGPMRDRLTNALADDVRFYEAWAGR